MKLLLSRILFILALLGHTLVFAGQKPLGINPIEGPLGDFYKTEITKIAVHVILKSQQYEIFFEANSKIESERNVDFIHMIFKNHSRNAVNLKFEYMKKGVVEKHVSLQQVSRRRLLFYSRVALYRLIFGKEYVDKNFREIRDEAKDFERKSNKLMSALKTKKKDVPFLVETKPEKKKKDKKYPPIVEGPLPNKYPPKPPKDPVLKKPAETEKVAQVTKKPKKAEKEEKANPSAFNEAATTAEEKKRVDSFFQPASILVSAGHMILSKQTTDLVTANYNYTSAVFRGNYYKPIDRDNSAFLVDFKIEQPLSKIVTTVGEDSTENSFDRAWGLSVSYLNPIPALNLFALFGLDYKKEQFVNLAQRNENLKVGTMSVVYIHTGFRMNLKDYIGINSFVQTVLGKTFFSKLDYDSTQELNADGIALKFGIGGDVYRKYGLLADFIYRSHSIREKTTFADNSIGGELALYMKF